MLSASFRETKMSRSISDSISPPIFLRPRVCQTSAFESDNLFFGS
ncbi:hypothetical protein LFML04_0319 [Leptospirillum ferriphilum ML-04]|uniref:Uncharacterized protein n=1 Tax=Leptospirillum ferriphilum (strain ML-04) TaxID=1048260 RepID=J9Z7Y8_LEPFM|nr:hypothetical protein LFML04_0319 [Leptospirillum ferriphilum ML-04]